MPQINVRTIQFPASSLGNLYLVDEDKVPKSHLEKRDLGAEFISVGSARGKRQIPLAPNQRLLLAINDGDFPNEKLLEGIAADAVDIISGISCDQHLLAVAKHLCHVKGLIFTYAPSVTRSCFVASTARLAQIVHLSLGGQGLGVPSADVQSCMDALEHLSCLKQLRLPAEYFCCLTAIAKFPSLETLSSTHMSCNPSRTLLERLCESASLRNLTLTNFCLYDYHLEVIGRMENLESLDISHNREVTDCGLKHLQNLKNLRRLNIGYTHATEKGIEFISEISTLEELEVADMNFTDKGSASLVKLSQLRRLHIYSTTSEWFGNNFTCEFTDASLENIAKLTNLESLWLCCPQLDKTRAKRPITARGINFLEQLDKLSELTLRWCKLTDAEVQCISKLKHLRVLDISGNDHVTPASVRYLTQLKLEELDLSSIGGNLHANGMPDVGAIKSLKRLDIGLSSLSDAGLAAIATLPNLEYLNIASRKITIAGMRSLIALKRLKHLEMSYTNADDDVIAILQQMPGLCKVNTQDTNMSMQGRAYVGDGS